MCFYMFEGGKTMTMKFDTWCRQCSHVNNASNIVCGSCEFNDGIMPSRFLARKEEPPKWHNKESISGEYEQLAQEIGKLVDTKQKAYGDSFSKAEDFLRLLYPNGIRKHQYKDLLTIVRIFDKLMRIATDKDALGESPYKDIGGYALLGLMADKKENKDEH
jgi:hypothetical protein